MERTAERRGEGWLVLFHTTANTSWSNLPISGLFLEMMRRLLALSRGVSGEGGERLLPPLANLDGRGRLVGPASTAVAVASTAVGDTEAGPRHPPGYYGSEESRRALNLARGRTELAAVPPPPTQRFSTPGGSPTDSISSANFVPIHGESLEGLSTTVLPVTSAAVVIPTRMASGKFHGGMTAPTPSGMYRSSFRSPGIRVRG